jgi:hypothetical protein
MVDFILKHPNIGAAISYHTHSGVILRPMGTQSDDDMIPEDLWSIKRFSELGAKLTGYPAISIWHDFKYHPKEVITGTQDWVYEHLGALFWVVEIWAPNKEAGITDYKWVDWYREHPVEDDLKLIKWSDEQCGGPGAFGLAAVPASAARRGRDRRLGQDELLAQSAAAPARTRGGALPGLDDADRAVAAEARAAAHRGRALGDDTWRVKLAVANSGWLPAYVSKRALRRKIVRGVMFEIHLPEGDASIGLVSGKPRYEGRSSRAMRRRAR